MSVEDFVLFLEKKKINKDTFRVEEEEMYAKFQELFLQIGERSFSQQKLFLLNKLRLRFPV